MVRHAGGDNMVPRVSQVTVVAALLGVAHGLWSCDSPARVKPHRRPAGDGSSVNRLTVGKAYDEPFECGVIFGANA